MTLATSYQPATHSVLSTQLQDIVAMLLALNGVEEAEEDSSSSRAWGDGFRATIRGPIPIVSDASGAPEYLGWLIKEEFGWRFTQFLPAGSDYQVVES